jgi:hypothetical protein
VERYLLATRTSSSQPVHDHLRICLGEYCCDTGWSGEAVFPAETLVEAELLRRCTSLWRMISGDISAKK